MNQIPQDIIDKVLEAANIIEVIGEDITLKKQGVNYIGVCPFHDDKKPSLVVSPAKGIYKCFACGAGGNVFKFLMEHRGFTYPDAIREMGKKYHIEVPAIELTPEQQQATRDKESTMVVMTAAQDLFRKNLQTVPEAAAYLSNRKISRETAELYGLGFAFDFDGLTRALVSQGYQEQYIIAAGLGYINEDKNKLKDTFWKRILFPFYSKTGQVIGYTGRAINDQAAKYKNTGDTILFNKGCNIFGLFQARQAIAKADCVYIVEGQFDVLSMVEVGIHNVVGGSGTAFTKEQRKLLHNITTNVVFIYDGDAAGIAAAEKNLPAFVADAFQVRCVLLPEGKDPDDMAKKLGDGFSEWLTKQTKSYVDFMAKVLFKDDDDEFTRLDKTKKIVSVIAKEREAVIRDRFLSLLTEPSGYDLDALDGIMNETHIPEAPDKVTPGFFGMEFIENYINPDDRVIHLTGSFERFQKLIGEKEPWLYYSGVPSTPDIQALAQLADRIVVHSPCMECDARHEHPDVLMMKALFKFGLTVDVAEEGSVHGFIYSYVDYYGDLLLAEHPTPEVSNEYITRCAEMISYTKAAIQTVNMEDWAKLLHMKKNTLKELIKPFANERKSKRKMEQERGDVYDSLIEMDTDRLPDYVEQNEEYSKMLRRYGYFPLLNKEGTPVSYMFKTDSNSYRRVADFYIEPLFHVYSPKKEENRRVIRINRLYVNKPTYVEWPSSVFVKLTTLQEMLINEGAYNFENGDARDYSKIWNCISYNFPKCLEMKVYGQQEEGCFIFANGIFHEVDGAWKFDYTDELGLMKHDDTIFYSPSYSKINVGARKDNDKYEQDRWLIYSETPEKKRISFARWASLMNEVYRINDNGKWALLYSIMCAFRSDIHPINRHFTAIFFIGPTMSGKTQIAVSIRSLFVKPEAPSFNLNSGTDAAFFSILERFRDVPQIFEEYNDDMISDVKFQGLKQTCYDGEGKQKRKAATGNDIETSKVNAPAVILGQEAPQKDDNALSNRVVLCEVPKRESINEDHAQQIFQELKEAEKAGLSYLLLEILELRPIVRAQFPTLLKQCSKELQGLVESSGSRSGDQTRVINTVSMFLTICKLLTTYAPHLQLPFTYEEFLQLAAAKVRSQVDMLVKTDKLAMFFNTIDYLIDKGSIKYGRDFKIERPTRLKLKGGVEKILQPTETAVLYMNLSNIHKMYASAMSNGDKPLSLTTLEVNLNSSPAYIGQVSNTRFKWMEAKEVPVGGVVPDNDNTGQTKPNMAMMRVMETKEKQTSAVVLNYDILSKMMGIDFEREERPDLPPVVEQKLPF